MLLHTMDKGHILGKEPQSTVDPVKDAQCAHQPNAFLHGGPGTEGHPSDLDVQGGLSALRSGHQRPSKQHLAPATQCLAAAVEDGHPLLGHVETPAFLNLATRPGSSSWILRTQVMKSWFGVLLKAPEDVSSVDM